jgi:hypothetical protein
MRVMACCKSPPLLLDAGRALWRGDALRKEALASAELGGERVDW